MSQSRDTYIFNLFIVLAFGWSSCYCQQSYGAKPKISINGISCAIENQQFSCLTKTCDSVIIFSGDSIRFCTEANIDLTSDTSYYMQWNFNGSSNYPSAIFNKAPSSLPICYSPTWPVPGNYTIDVFNNNYLTAYPGSDCYAYGPSHWSIKVIVNALSSTNEILQPINITAYPNPTSEQITIETEEEEMCTLKITNMLGQNVAQKTFRKKVEINVSILEEGLYLLEVYNQSRQKYHSEKLSIK